MNIQFSIKNETIILRSDSMGYELCKPVSRKDRNTGEQYEEWEPFKYFASLEQALNRISDMKVRASDARSLEELKVAVEAARHEVCQVWKASTEVK